MATNNISKVGTIEAFKAALGGGRRNNLFYVQIGGSVPTEAMDQLAAGKSLNDFYILCQSASIPDVKVAANLEANFMGRKLPIPGDRDITQTLALRILNDDEYSWHRFFVAWMNYLGTHNEIKGAVSSDVEITVAQLDRAVDTSFTADIMTQAKSKYVYYNCWPSSVGAINMNWEAGTVSAFDVTITFDYYSIPGGNTGNTSI